jgi:hypothetical protein
MVGLHFLFSIGSELSSDYPAPTTISSCRTQTCEFSIAPNEIKTYEFKDQDRKEKVVWAAPGLVVPGSEARDLKATQTSGHIE